jgi:hypothetical protein
MLFIRWNQGCFAGGWSHAKPRSREGKRSGLLWCVVNCLLSFQLSRIYSLWHGCHGRLTPDPSRPGGPGEEWVGGGLFSSTSTSTVRQGGLSTNTSVRSHWAGGLTRSREGSVG